MARRCQVCGRLYDGWRCPCRKTMHSRGRRNRGAGGGRRWRIEQARARILGGWPGVEPEDSSVCPRCGTKIGDDGRCPACFERWRDECEDAGWPVEESADNCG